MTDQPRLIEVAFPLKQASIDSVHEKNVRHGHISTLHIWPARRPLAASRAALIATLLPDPGDPEERKALLERLAGRVVTRSKRVKTAGGGFEEQLVEETEGGILHWGRESGPDLQWFRQRIREAYGGRPPRVLDPFAGGGAIPLEAMRLGCEVTAVDINPVAWFILKCTLEYPQKLAGQTRPLPDFALQDREFMTAFFKAQGLTGARLQSELDRISGDQPLQPDLFSDTSLPAPRSALSAPEADLAWHVRAWGRWVLARAREELAPYYPMIDGKPTVAYLWARTVTCKNCRATLPLLKTRWLCKKDKKRVLLTMEPNADRSGVVFNVQADVPVAKGSPAQRREHEKKLGAGTMSRAGATCPCCGSIMTMEDIRLEGQAGRLGQILTSVVIEGQAGKEYRLPTNDELQTSSPNEVELAKLFAAIPFGLPTEPTPAGGGSGASRAFSVQGYGLKHWRDLYTPRQLVALGTFVLTTRQAAETLPKYDYDDNWKESIVAFLACNLSKTIHLACTLCTWHQGNQQIRQVFSRYALPITWDYAESVPSGVSAGSYISMLESTEQALKTVIAATHEAQPVTVIRNSATNRSVVAGIDLIVTDPPYYDAIPYSDAMDFFYVWLRRILHGLSPQMDTSFAESLSPKWDKDRNDGELIDDAARFEGDSAKSKSAYEDGMFRSFQVCFDALTSDGRLVVVFAHKHPDAWETLVAAIIRAGFVVDGSWPIQTELGSRTRALSSAALASSIWLVCRKRPETARPGWDNRVLEEMRQKITVRLRDFWDAGIRGPDFVWAATGPAMEAYSQYPVVKQANAPGERMTVSEFLTHVRRMVVDFVVGRVLTGDGDSEAVTGLDNVTAYYLLHRYDFGFADTPAGACILYAISCDLSDKDLADRYDLLARTGGAAAAEDEEQGDEEVETTGTGSTLRLKTWQQRKRPTMGYDPALDDVAQHLPMFPDMPAEVSPSRELPLIDQVHRLMHLWRAGDVVKVDDYLDVRGLRRNKLFQQLLQALIELAAAGSEERALLESISNHLGARGTALPSLFAGNTSL